ncbi:MAG: GHMP kinase [Candidatus Firestonebacteria bacterium]|nr:GHMP kinase [Candidatus Firestonebacteria bacterium]
MIITRAPFRISFAGGGSDLKSFYEKNGYGAVISTTINKYMYIMLHPYFQDKIRIKYSKLEDVDSINEIQHPIVRECLRLVKIDKGIEIASIADVPAGTGIGSSSTFAVSLLHALYSYKKIFVTKEKLAKESCEIEIDVMKEPIGKQDQYAASYGGLNYIRFNSDGSVFVEPLILKNETRSNFKKNLLMFYVGNERKASSILKKQNTNMKNEDKFEMVKKMVKLTDELKIALLNGKIKRFGEVLHEGWLLKRNLSGNITTPIIDEHYENALKAGALGGKILGAGGGGFFLFYCEPKYQNNLKKALKLRELNFEFDFEGSKILYFN